MTPPAGPRTSQTLSQSQARRIALAAQGFTDRPHAAPTLRSLDRAVARTGVLQVDSVNVFARAHLMPLYARMGPFDPALLERAASGSRDRRLVEYWAHVQAYMPVDLWPAMHHRRVAFRASRGKWGMGADETLEPQVLAAVAQRGPLTARELESEMGATRSKEHWGWNWSQARKVLDYLYSVGDVAIAGRTRAFEVVYDLPQRVLPARVLAAPTPSREEADLELVRRAVRSLGVADVASLADYYRMPVAATRASLRTLLETGEVEQVTVQGWSRPAFLDVGARLPRRVGARTLLSPFDPVVWHRPRAEALFDFHYRIEIYTPVHRRVHGYYVLPFLLGDRVAARVDLKADRRRGVLGVPGAFAEAYAPADTAEQLAAELRRAAAWVGCDRVEVGARGDLAGPLAAALDSAPA
ncbi:winged helix-turn-helix domain-containing protein [Nocardioides jishulii]|uniref:Winged helix-turn-helix domain-containing protein n=1 Tax=Nocardioides jishulii TaxID=2575440 RepID=A0A4U2YJ05_9ACTN|nr:crosslink repair DNA glycosylase YcaQ family protein [Nocardioides jishulii]QCX28196.1 winged helix-turn-helix domain-containing protein [Nocardioides jishulii]TKI60860.1 winged helix-turn-helix domain-containing protein [Nocardioides jishulii]